MTQDEMIALRREGAKRNNNSKYSISVDRGDGSSKAYKPGTDKDGLTRESRSRVDEIKDGLTYGSLESELAEVWD